MPHEVDDYLFNISTIDQYQMPLICLLFAPQNAWRSFAVSLGSPRSVRHSIALLPCYRQGTEARRGEVTWPHVSQRRVTRKPSSLDIVLPPPSLSAGRSWVAPLPCKVHSILGGTLSSPQLPPNPTQSPVEPSYPVPQDGIKVC